MEKREKKCDYCGKEVGGLGYELKLEIYACPDVPEIKEEDLQRDIVSEMEALIEAMEKMDVDELSDEVYESYRFTLCSDCRKEIHQRLKKMRDKKIQI